MRALFVPIIENLGKNNCLHPVPYGRRIYNHLYFYARYACVVNVLFSSREPKAQISFSDQFLSVICRRRCRKLFTLASFSPENLGQFRQTLSRTFKFVLIMDQVYS